MPLKPITGKSAKKVTCYASGVCYINSALHREIKDKCQSLPDGLLLQEALTVKQTDDGRIVLVPCLTKDLDSRKVTKRGGGGSFSNRDLARLVASGGGQDPKSLLWDPSKPTVLNFEYIEIEPEFWCFVSKEKFA